MVSKCASSSCSTLFRYLHEGKLYLIDRKVAAAGRKQPPDFEIRTQVQGWSPVGSV